MERISADFVLLLHHRDGLILIHDGLASAARARVGIHRLPQLLRQAGVGLVLEWIR